MTNESFQPISVKAPNQCPRLFQIRCVIDLQLLTIVRFLKPELLNFSGRSIIDVGSGEAPWREWMGIPDHRDRSFRAIVTADSDAS